MSKPFLTAEWQHLCLFTYAVPHDVLRPYLPPGLQLDEREGHAFASLVAFNFLNTKVFGVGWPGFRSFPELNLRFYVRDGDRRGVVFVREIVSSRLICWFAHRFYNEPYAPAPLRHDVRVTDSKLEIAGKLQWDGREQTWELTARNEPTLPPNDSTEHFFKEHQWGYGTSRAGERLTYEVRHPHWRTFPVETHRLRFDFGAVYGPQFACLNGAEPASIVLAEGSAVEVFPAAAVA